MHTIRVLLTDDHAIVRASLRALLETAGDMRVIGEAENGQQAVREAARLRPQVVVMDLAMPRLNGVEAARQIAYKVPTARVLILSSYSDDHHLQQAVAAGVAGYLMKESAADELLAAIRETWGGGVFFSPSLLHRLWEARREELQRDCSIATRPVNLTQREAEILQLVAEGYANKQTADLLSLSRKTVEKHRQTLMQKLNLHKTASLTRYAAANGVVEVNNSQAWRGAPTPGATPPGQRKPCLSASAAQPQKGSTETPAVGLLGRKLPATGHTTRLNDLLPSVVSRVAARRRAVSKARSSTS